MKRLLALLMVAGLIAAGCSSGEPAEPAADGEDASTVQLDAGAAEDEPATNTAPDNAEPAADGGDAGAAEDEPSTGLGEAEPAEEMMLDELSVAYLLRRPTANQVAQAERTYDEALGMTVNWIPFASGGDMAQAMETGATDISYSQGLTPFASFVTSGSGLLLVGVAVSYADADNCVAHPDFGVTAENAAETLAGQSIYTPLGDVAHFKLLKMLEHLGVDTATVNLIESEGGPAAVAALDSGEVALACAFGGAVNQMIANGGNLVMTGAEQEAIGIRVFDVISTSADFAEAYPSVVTAFLQVTEDAVRRRVGARGGCVEGARLGRRGPSQRVRVPRPLLGQYRLQDHSATGWRPGLRTAAARHRGCGPRPVAGLQHRRHRHGGHDRGLPGRIGLSSRQSAITVGLCLLT